MEIPRSNKAAFSLLFVVSMVLSFVRLSTPLYSTSQTCDFPALFNFGDSNSDTGGLAAAFYPLPLPYGETYFQMPIGRYSDGRLIIDFIAQSLNVPFLGAYIDSLGTNFSQGANYATSASTIRLPTLILPRSGFSPFYLDVQYGQFKQFIARSQMIKSIGGPLATRMPKNDYFSKALYTFDIGQNDLGEGFFANMSIPEVRASVPDIINGFIKNVKNIHSLGARFFWIHNTGPIGCLPYILVNFPARKDRAGCAKPYNDVAMYFNNKLKEAIVQLRKDLPSSAITYVDVYSAKYSLFTETKKFGFELPLTACCGYGGGEYNYFNNVTCGTSITVNGSTIFVGSCEKPSTRVNWDGIHYTDAANKFVFNRISTGAFSDPPIPLRRACHRN